MVKGERVRFCPRNDKKYALPVIISIAVIPRILLSLTMTGILWPDSTHYYNYAVIFLATGKLDHIRIYHTPLYPIFLAAFLSFGKARLTGIAVIAAQHILGILSIIFFYLAARRIFGGAIAFLSAIVFSIHALLLYYETVVQTEILFIFLLSIVAYLAGLLNENGSKKVLLTALGSVCALLTLTRPVAEFFIFIPVIALVPKTKNIRSFLVNGFFIIFAYFLVLSPWIYCNFKNRGFLGVTRGEGLNLYLRAYDLEQFTPVENSSYSQVEKLYYRFQGHGKTYFRVRDKLITRGYTERTVDNMMFGFALEAVKANIGEFVISSGKQFLKIFWSPKKSIGVCPSERGDYLCAKWSQHLHNSVFPNRPRMGHLKIKKILSFFFTSCPLNIRIISLLALCGIIASFYRKDLALQHLIFLLLTICYFAGLPALLNTPEDRYRLPIDFILFAFASYALINAYKFLLDASKWNA